MKKVIYSTLLAGGMLLAGIGPANANEFDFGGEGFGSEIQLSGTSGLFNAITLMPDLSAGMALSITFNEYEINSTGFADFLSLGADLGLDMGISGYNDFLNNGIAFDDDDDEIIVTGTRNGDPWTTSVYPEALAMLGITIDEYLYGPAYNVADGVTDVQVGGGSSSDDSSDDENTDIPTDVVPTYPTGEISDGAFDQFMRNCGRTPGCSFTVTVSGPVHDA